MAEENVDWAVSGDCVEACTSPPVCPYYWGSSTPRDLHGGRNVCEGVFTFNIQDGHYGEINLSGLKVGFGFNSPEGGTASRDPWQSILYIDERADDRQAQALETIFKACWRNMGEVLKVKRTAISFAKEPVGTASSQGFKHTIEYTGIYNLIAEPLMAMNGEPRFISGMMGGTIYVGKSTVNRFDDSDLPRAKWDSPEMSNTYYPFALNPAKLSWVP